jgi:hypothetical protein
VRIAVSLQFDKHLIEDKLLQLRNIKHPKLFENVSPGMALEWFEIGASSPLHTELLVGIDTLGSFVTIVFLVYRELDD